MQGEMLEPHLSAAVMDYCSSLIRKTQGVGQNTMPSLLSPVLILALLKEFSLAGVAQCSSIGLWTSRLQLDSQSGLMPGFRLDPHVEGMQEAA